MNCVPISPAGDFTQFAVTLFKLEGEDSVQTSPEEGAGTVESWIIESEVQELSFRAASRNLTKTLFVVFAFDKTKVEIVL